MNAPVKIGKYEVTGELGKGAMGVVYSGIDPVIHRDVALKVLRKSDLDPEDAPSLLERFKREAQAAGKLNHPNIVAIYEYGEDGEYAFIAMECVSGKSLRDHLPGRLPARAAAVPRHPRAAARGRSSTRIRAASCIATSSRRTS